MRGGDVEGLRVVVNTDSALKIRLKYSLAQEGSHRRGHQKGAGSGPGVGSGLMPQALVRAAASRRTLRKLPALFMTALCRRAPVPLAMICGRFPPPGSNRRFRSEPAGCGPEKPPHMLLLVVAGSFRDGSDHPRCRTCWRATRPSEASRQEPPGAVCPSPTQPTQEAVCGPVPGSCRRLGLDLPSSPSRRQGRRHCPWQKKPGRRSGTVRGAGCAAMMEH
jgi:hypothetical protein